jgi:hypothetical protein
MAEVNISRLRNLISGSVGPAPWYWQTFPVVSSTTGKRLVWTHHGEQGSLAYLVSLASEDKPEKPLLALNTYCRPFLVPPSYLAIWCPEGGSIRIACFDPSQLKAFDFADVAGWFKPSSERIYAATPPVAELEVSSALEAGTHTINVPAELRGVEELIVPTSYPTQGSDDPAFALYIFYLQAGLAEVLPQLWFTTAQYEIGKQWIPRVARDPETHRIAGQCFGVGSFLLQEDGRRLDCWFETTSP